MVTKLKIGPCHKFKRFSDQAFDEFNIRENFRICRSYFLNINVFRNRILCEFDTIDVSKTCQAKAKEGNEA